MATLRTEAFRAASLQLVQSSRAARVLARWLVLLLAFSGILSLLLPWQQTARGTGTVVALDPQQRQQTITAPVKGIVKSVLPGLVEGAVVKRGDVIVEIEPNAANLIDRTEGQLFDLNTKLETSKTKVVVYGEMVEKYEQAAGFTQQAADEMVEAAREKLAAKEVLVPGYEAKEWQARVNLERQQELAGSGIRSDKEIEYLRKDWEVAKSELEGIQREVDSLKAELAEKGHKREELIVKAKAEVDYYRALQQEAAGQVAAAEKEIKDVEVKLSEYDRLVIKAPCDGRIFRLHVFEQGQQIKEGDDLFTIVPDTAALAVELYLRGMDTPLVKVGDEVRLQFDGWPAVQFAGWPSVAVGTFGAQVVSIDPTDDGTGRFRIQVLPIEGEEWPEERFLRQGVQANGWVLLGQVTIAYEFWRQLNGFPPTVAKSEAGKDDIKKVKLPK